MSSRNGTARGAWTLALVISGVSALTPAGAGAADPVRIGMVGSLFRDVPRPLMMAMMQPFGALMKSQTGMTGEMVPSGDAEELGRQLAAGQVHLGVFHGFEFAWARLRQPDLQPLMIAVNQQRHLRAHLVVRADAGAAALAELQGKTVALPRGTREHVRLFLDRECQACGRDPQAHFGTVTTPATVEDALDDVVDDVAQAAVVDGVALDCFKRRKPGRYDRLKTLKLSEVFPAGVIAFRPGGLDEDTLQRFRVGMISANQNPLGKQMLAMWKLTAFEPVPDDYEATLDNIVRTYPPDAKSKVAK